jgi:hypothetical protein
MQESFEFQHDLGLEVSSFSDIGMPAFSFYSLRASQYMRSNSNSSNNNHYKRSDNNNNNNNEDQALEEYLTNNGK